MGGVPTNGAPPPQRLIIARIAHGCNTMTSEPRSTLRCQRRHVTDACGRLADVVEYGDLDVMSMNKQSSNSTRRHAAQRTQ